YPLWRVLDDRRREAHVQLERGPAQRGTVADALDLELLLEALRHALDHVRDQRPRQTGQRAVLTAVGRTIDSQRALVLRDLHPLRNVAGELAERAVDHHAARADRDRDSGRQFNW